MTSEASPELLTVEEFAERLKVSRGTVFGWLKNRTLEEGTHYFRLGRVLRFLWRVDLLIRPAGSTREVKSGVSRLPRPPKPKAHRTSQPERSPAVNLDY